MTWKPSPRVENDAVRLTSSLLACDPGDQLDVLALTARLWCYHRDQLRLQAGDRP